MWGVMQPAACLELLRGRADDRNALGVRWPGILQLGQNAAACLLHHATPLLEELHWLPVGFWIQLQVLDILLIEP